MKAFVALTLIAGINAITIDVRQAAASSAPTTSCPSYATSSSGTQCFYPPGIGEPQAVTVPNAAAPSSSAARGPLTAGNSLGPAPLTAGNSLGPPPPPSSAASESSTITSSETPSSALAISSSNPPVSGSGASLGAGISSASPSYPNPYPISSPPGPRPTRPPTDAGDAQIINDGYNYSSVKFTTGWPNAIRTGETVHMEWTGGTGRYDVWWLQSWKDEYDCYTQQYYFLRNEPYTSYDFYFSTAGCWYRDASIMFGVQDSAGEPGYSQRDHDTGPLKYIIRGPDDDYNVC